MNTSAQGQGAFANEKTRPYAPKGRAFGQIKETACVASCCKMLLGSETPEAYWCQLLSLERDGIHPRNIPGAMAQLGLAAAYREDLSFEGLSEIIKSGPAIVSITTLVTGGRHAIVVDGIEGDFVSVRDPWPPLRGSTYKVSITAFTKAWEVWGDAAYLL